MGLVHWWVMLYLFDGDGITVKNYLNSLLTISYSQKRLKNQKIFINFPQIRG